MLRSRRITVAAWSGLAALATIVAPLATAGITVSPLKQEISVHPGETAKFYLSINNRPRGRGDKPQSVRLDVVDFEATERGGLVFKPASEGGTSASLWITLGKSELTLGPGKGERVECTVKAPYTAAGEYYSAIMVTLGETARNEKGLTIGFRIASGVFVTVPGQTFPRQAKIERCDVAWPRMSSSATQPSQEDNLTWPTVAALVKNTGKSRFDGSGTLEIMDAKGQRVLSKPLASQRPTVFGGDSRLFECPLNKALPAGQYKAKITFDYQSQWAKTSHVFPLRISPGEALVLARLAEKSAPVAVSADYLNVKFSPEKLATRIAAGGRRTLGVTVRNVGHVPVRYTARIIPQDDTLIGADWVTLDRPNFHVAPFRSVSLPLSVHVPAGGAGLYKAVLLVEGGGPDGATTQTRIPVELTIKETR